MLYLYNKSAHLKYTKGSYNIQIILRYYEKQAYGF